MTDAWMNRFEAKLDRIDDTVTRMDTRLTGVETTVTGMATRLGGVEAEQHRQGVLLEALGDKLDGVTEHVIDVRERMGRGFAKVYRKLDERVQPIEAASRHFASTLATRKRPAAKARARKPG